MLYLQDKHTPSKNEPWDIEKARKTIRRVIKDSIDSFEQLGTIYPPNEILKGSPPPTVFYFCAAGTLWGLSINYLSIVRI